VIVLISRVGSWHRLAQKFPAAGPAEGRTFRLQTGMIGQARYRNALHVWLGPQGIRLDLPRIFRPGHPPLFLPWEAVQAVGEGYVRGVPCCELEVGGQERFRVLLPKSLFAGVAELRMAER
jgi:hypothetical protein